MIKFLSNGKFSKTGKESISALSHPKSERQLLFFIMVAFELHSARF